MLMDPKSSDARLQLVHIPPLYVHLTTHDSQSIFDQQSHEPLPETEEKVNSLVGRACLTQMALILATWGLGEEGAHPQAPSRRCDYETTY